MKLLIEIKTIILKMKPKHYDNNNIYNHDGK